MKINPVKEDIKIFNENKSKENYTEYLNLNDLIILDTDGMYDGKTLKR